MRYLDKILIVALAHASLLLPERIFSHNDRSYPLLYQKVDQALASSVQIMVHLTVALVGDVLHLLCDTLSVFFGKAQLQLFHAFVVPLVPRFERPTVNQSRHEACTV